MMYIRILSFLVFTLLCIIGCREDEYITYMTDEDTGITTAGSGEIIGMYLLNEGNMGSNKCTLDYLDLSGEQSTIHYYRNIYAHHNPQQVLELGDVGNDIQIYGDQLWMVINCSNKVEVCRAADASHLGKVEIPNCRYVTFDQGFAYVSSYAGPVELGTHCPLGRVYKVDTLSLQKVDSVTVGFQPEEIAIIDHHLYVANSGGYRIGSYDNRVSVIDLDKMSVVQEIELVPNLHRMAADRYGQVWVSSRGNYLGQPSTLCWIDTRQGITGQIDVPVSEMCLAGDSLYYIGASFSYLTGKNSIDMGIIDVRTRQVIQTDMFDDDAIQSIQLPYGIIVNPEQRDFYLMDAKNYVSSGELLHFLPDGTFEWRVWTGDIPSRAVFLRDTNKKSNT